MFKGGVSCGAACCPRRMKHPLEKNKMTRILVITNEGGVQWV